MTTPPLPNEDRRLVTWMARLASLLFHPIWLPLIFAVGKNGASPALPQLVTHIAVFLVAVPGIATLVWMRLRGDSDWFVMTRDIRVVPFVAMLVGLVLFIFSCNRLPPASRGQTELVAICTLLTVTSLVVTLFWKISIHLMAWGLASAYLVQFAVASGTWWPLLLVLGISGGVAWARWHLKSHDWAQLVVGYGVGIAVGLLVSWWFALGAVM